MQVAALFLPVFIAISLMLHLLLPLREEVRTNVHLARVATLDAVEAHRLLDAIGFEWPPQGPVPRIGFTRLPEGLDLLETDARKSVFLRLVLPLIIAENERIARERAWVEAALARGPLVAGSRAARELSHMALRYGVEGDLNDPEIRGWLLRRMDVVPVALALAQAANESAWGTSRFAREGNNLFGQWTWQHDAGLVPHRRARGARHLVRSYPDLRSAVRGYLHNINVGHAYVGLRYQRELLRKQGIKPDALTLAGGLVRYSERGEAYVDEVRTLIRSNGLMHAESAALGPWL
jgi:Bax protein